MKIGIVGTGKVAVGNYLPVLKVLQRDAELGYYNRSSASAVTASQTFTGQVFSSIKDMGDWRPDVAFVLTSETCHYEVGHELIAAGVPRVFFEKPLVAKNGQAHVTEADFHAGMSLLKFARDRGCETAMMFNYRFFDHVLAAKRIVNERKFGNLINVSGTIHYACWSHCIDLIHHFGGSVAELIATQGVVKHSGQGIEAFDIAAAFKFESGGTGTVIGTAGLQWHFPLFELILTFQNGRLHVRDLDGDLEVLDGLKRTHERYSPVHDKSRWDHYSASFQKALAAYFENLRAGIPPPVPGLDGLRELQFEAAIRRSLVEARPIALQSEFPLTELISK